MIYDPNSKAFTIWHRDTIVSPLEILVLIMELEESFFHVTFINGHIVITLSPHVSHVTCDNTSVINATWHKPIGPLASLLLGVLLLKLKSVSQCKWNTFCNGFKLRLKVAKIFVILYIEIIICTLNFKHLNLNSWTVRFIF